MKVQTPRIPQPQEAAPPPPAPRRSEQTENDASEFERHMRAQEESNQAGKAPSPLTAGFGREAGPHLPRDIDARPDAHLVSDAELRAEGPQAGAARELVSPFSTEAMLELARRRKAIGPDSAMRDPSSSRAHPEERETVAPVAVEASARQPVSELKPVGASVAEDMAPRKMETAPLHAEEAPPIERERFAPISVKADAAESRKPEEFHRIDEVAIADSAEAPPLVARKDPGFVPADIEDATPEMERDSLDMEADASIEIRASARRLPGSVSEVESQLAAALQVQSAVIAQAVRIEIVNRPESLPLEVLKAL